MRTKSQKTLRELATGVGALVVAVLAQAVIVWAVIDNLQRIDVADDEARSELQLYSRMFEAAQDADIGLRGFLADADPQSLELYKDGVQRFERRAPELRAFVAEDPPANRARVDDIVRHAEAWNEVIAKPQIAIVAAGGRAAWDSAQDQAHLEALRADFQALRRFEIDELNTRARLWVTALANGRLTLIAGSAAALAFALLIAWRSVRRVLAQQAAEKEAADRIAEALERAQAAERAKTTFLANMSHEMRTPLNGVAGLAQALATTGLSPAQREMVGAILNSAADLEGLIDNLLTLSQAGAPRAGKDTADWAFHLGDEMRGIAAEHGVAARAKGLAFDLRVAPEAEIRVRGDAARLEKVLTCLLSNAVKFTDHGEVRLVVERLGGDRCRFTVSDTGVGFDESRKAVLFETFTQSDDSPTRRFGGAGLGLALARHLAQKLGGRLDCRSVPGAGSTFAFELDLATAAEPAGTADRPAPAQAPMAAFGEALAKA